MIEKCFYTDSYLTKWDTKINEIIQRDDKFLITLEKSYFYPGGGGQPSDRGTIDDIKVLDVLEEGNKIYHVLNKLPNEKKVLCKIDFKRRFSNMQQHTGEHILAATFYKLYQGVSNAFHMGEEYVSIDISLPEVTLDMLRKVEDEVNQIIYTDVEVKTYMVDLEKSKSIPLRKQPKVSEDLRIVEIEGVDFCPCCGTHVNRTGEVGILKILKTEKSKGATRIYFQCGRKVLEDYRKKHEVISDLNERFSANENTLIEKVNKYVEDFRKLELEIKELKQEISLKEAKGLVKEAQGPVVYGCYENKKIDEIMFIAKQVFLKGQYIFIGISLESKKIFISHNTDLIIHCGNLLKEEIKTFNAKGGGSPTQAQGSFENTAELLKCGDNLRRMCREMEDIQ